MTYPDHIKHEAERVRKVFYDILIPEKGRNVSEMIEKAARCAIACIEEKKKLSSDLYDFELIYDQQIAYLRETYLGEKP